MVAQLGYFAAVQQIAAAVRTIQQSEEVHEGGFPGSGTSDNGSKFAVADVEIDTGDGVHAPCGAFIRFFQTMCMDHLKSAPLECLSQPECLNRLCFNGAIVCAESFLYPCIVHRIVHL